MKVVKLLGLCALVAMGASCKCGRDNADEKPKPPAGPPAEAECLVGNDSLCGEGYVCEAIPWGGGVGTCKDVAPCRVGNDSACPAGQHCVGNNNQPGAPGSCEDRTRNSTECHVGDNTPCEEGHYCEGPSTGLLGTCQPLPEEPECFVGDNRCPAWQNCAGYGGNTQRGFPGYCQGTPACHVGDNSPCQPWQSCVGYGGLNLLNFPGYCYGLPECLVGDESTYTPWQECVGYAGNAPNAPGYLEDKPECRVGDNSNCLAWQSCEGYESDTPNTPGHCVDTPECRIGDSSCPEWQNCVGYGGNNEDDAPGTCLGEPECRLGEGGCFVWQNCEAYDSSTEDSAPGYCTGTPECLVGDDSNCPEWQNCVGYGTHNETGQPGTCQGEPECFVGLGGCPLWQNCVGYGGNEDGTPGACTGTPECLVGDNSCGTGKICAGYGGNNETGQPGSCQYEFPCTVGGEECEAWQICAAADETPGSPGHCLGTPGCYVDEGGCPLWQNCVGYGDNTQEGAPGYCTGEPPCLVGDDSNCPEWQNCVGYGTHNETGQPGSCQGEPHCFVGDNSNCPPWQNCAGYGGNHTTNAPGYCDGSPECLVGDLSCPAWQSCISYSTQNNPGEPGTCQGEPHCLVGDNSNCPPWQNCTGYGGNNTTDAPGYCDGSPECLVGDFSCPPWQSCMGYFSQTPAAPGACQGEPQCFVGDSSPCGVEAYACEGLPDAPHGEPGVCKDVAECRMGSTTNTCDETNQYACEGLNSQEEGAAGTCKDVAQCRMGSTTNTCDTSNDYVCEGLSSQEEGAAGFCKDMSACRVGDNSRCETGEVCVGKTHSGQNAAGTCEEDTLGKPCPEDDTRCIPGQVCESSTCIYGERDAQGHVVSTLSNFQLLTGGQFVVPLRAHGATQNSPNAGWVGKAEAQIHALARGPNAHEDFFVETPLGPLETGACSADCNPENTECLWTCLLPEGWAGEEAEVEVVAALGETAPQVWVYALSSPPALSIYAPSSAVLGHPLKVCAFAKTTDAPMGGIQRQNIQVLSGAGELTLLWAEDMLSPAEMCWTALLPPSLTPNNSISLKVSATATDSVGNTSAASYEETLLLVGISCEVNVSPASAVSAPLVFVNGRLAFAAGNNLHFFDVNNCALLPTSLSTGAIQGSMVAVGAYLAVAASSPARLLIVNAATPVIMGNTMACAEKDGDIKKPPLFNKGLSLLAFNTAQPLANPTTTPVRYAAPTNEADGNNSTLVAFTPSDSNAKTRCVASNKTGATAVLNTAHAVNNQAFFVYGETNGNKMEVLSFVNGELTDGVGADGVPAGVPTGIAVNNAGQVLLSANISTAMYSLRLWQNWASPLYSALAVLHFSPPVVDSQNRVYAVGYVDASTHVLHLLSANLSSISSIKLPSAAAGGIVGSPLIGQAPPGEDYTEIYVVNSDGRVFGFESSPSGMLSLLWTVELGFAVSPLAQPVLLPHSGGGGTLWVVGAQGQVRSIRVGSEGLSRTAAWPKAFRDNCNTGSRQVTPSNMPGCF